jgi:DNA-binding LacI/PurR family transcriptional regulator
LITQFTCPGVEVGQAAAELLERRSTSPTEEAQHILIEPILRERASVLTR